MQTSNPPAQSVLVTGGAGFFGRGFVKRLLALGVPRVCVFSRDEAKHAAMRAELADDRVRYFVGDVRDVQRLERAMDGIELVVHAAALKRVEVAEYDAAEVMKTNVLGSMNVIEAATSAGVAKVVALSTDKACEPVNAYGASKLASEKLFLAANNSRGERGPIFAVTRYGNVAGSTGSVIPTWRRALEQGWPVRVTHPDATRFWMTLDQAVDLVLETATGMVGGELQIPDLPAYRLADLHAAMDPYFTWPIGFPSLHITGLGPGEKLHESMRPGCTSADARRMSVDELRDALAHV